MSLIIDSIKIENFMRLKDVVIRFPERGVFGILADSLEDSDESNGVGKTTIIEAIVYCLSGQSRAKTETALIHYGAEFMKVTTILKDENNKKYKITRGRDNKGNGILEYKDEKSQGEKTLEAQKFIDDLLGIDKKDLELTIFFKQSEINKFMELSSSDTKKLLMKWQKNSHWEEKEKLTITQLKLEKEKLKQITLKIENLSKTADVNKLEEENTLLNIKKNNYNLRLNTINEELEKLLKNTNYSKEEIQNNILKQSKLNNQLEKLNNNKKQILINTKTIEELQKQITEENEIYNTKLNTFYITNLNENKLLNQKIENIKKNRNGVCPIIFEECDRIKITDEQLEELETEYEVKSETILKAQNELTKVKNIAKNNKLINEQINKLNTEIQVLKESLKNEQTIIEQLKEIEDILNNYNEEVDSNITLLKNEKKELENNLNTIRDSQAIINVKLQQIAENKTLVDQLYSEFEELNNHIGDLQYLAYMFGKNGIPSLEIENSFSQIQDEINSFLRSISKFDVIFKPDKELKTWEENCLSCNFIYPKNYKKHNCEKCHEPRKRKRKDEIQLSIVDNENEIGFEMCSGGIKTLISLAVRTAMTLLLKRTNGLNLDVLFLDEIDSAIDKKNKPLISDFVNSLCQNLGFKQVLWISHDRNISSNVDNTLLVTSNGAYSKVAWL
jgi:DNA repair exonuclease SbcCD ATPase subunit